MNSCFIFALAAKTLAKNNRTHPMKYLILLVLLFPLLAISQTSIDRSDELEPGKTEINKNIFRVLMSLSTDTRFSVTGSYEREIMKPFSLVLKAGPAFSKEYITTDPFGTEKHRWLLSLAASGEFRYYFNLSHRLKNQRTIQNYSGWYFSLEELLQTKPILIINKSGDETLSAGNRTYLNIGFQKQDKQTYYNFFAGTRFPGKIYENSVDVFDIIHGGITIGRVF